MVGLISLKSRRRAFVLQLSGLGERESAYNKNEQHVAQKLPKANVISLHGHQLIRPGFKLMFGSPTLVLTVY